MAKRDFLAGVIALSQENPTRFVNLVRDGWPEIKAAVDHGHTLKMIHQRLVEGGVRMSYRCFTMYVRRFRNAPGNASQKAEPLSAAPGEKPADSTRSTPEGTTAEPLAMESEPESKPEDPASDPYETIREHLNRKPRGFQWDEDVPDTAKL